MNRPRITKLRNELAAAARVLERRDAKITELEAQLAALYLRLDVLRAAVRGESARAEPEQARAGAA